MAISSGGGGIDTPMSDINTTPLVDVMLVLLIIFLIAIPVAIQSVEDLHLPIFKSRESEDKVENLQLFVTTTDASGLNPSANGSPSTFAGAAREGECRIYLNNLTPVSSGDLYDYAFNRLDNIVKRAGGAEVIRDNPDLVPQVHIRGDVNAPWRCVAGTIFNVQAAGYPTVGFISNPVNPDGS